MPIKMLSGLLAALALTTCLSACSTPCGEPGRLCAPAEPNTSADATHPRAADLVRPAPAPLVAPAAQASVQTMPVGSAESSAVTPAVAPDANAVRIGLMLPLGSGGLAGPAEAVRAGFMAAYERDRTGFVINVIETGDSADEALDAYMAAVKDNDLIVGPLARPAVSMVADSGAVSKPTIALNHPDSGGGPLPPKMLVIGLSIEDEARQVAQWAAAEHPKTSALIVSGNNAWQRRIAAAFAARWQQLGNTSQLIEVPVSSGYLHASGVNQVKTRIEAEPPALVFAALDVGQLRQVRAAFGATPVYGTASVNPGVEPGTAMAELDGVRFLDMPWQVQPDNPAVMVYPRRPGTAASLDLDRLYALGIDAFRVAREIALKPTSAFQMDGVTGRLSVEPGKGGLHFSRSETGALYQGGAYRLVDKKR